MKAAASGMVTAMRLAMADAQQAAERLASGRRVIHAGDDPARMSMIEKVRARLVSLDQASANADHGVLLVGVVDAGLASLSEILTRMRELAMQASNGTLSDDQRAALDDEVQSLKAEVERVAGSTSFNGHPLLEGGEPVTIQAGPDGELADQITIPQGDASALALGLGEVSIESAERAREALASIDEAASDVAGLRGEQGAVAQRLETASRGSSSRVIQASAAYSQMAGASIATEVSHLGQARLRMQAAVAALDRATGLPGLLVSLLQR